MAKELVLVVLMMAVWGTLLSKQLQCDNLSIVASINEGTPCGASTWQCLVLYCPL